MVSNKVQSGKAGQQEKEGPMLKSQSKEQPPDVYTTSNTEITQLVSTSLSQPLVLSLLLVNNHRDHHYVYRPSSTLVLQMQQCVMPLV